MPMKTTPFVLRLTDAQRDALEAYRKAQGHRSWAESIRNWLESLSK